MNRAERERLLEQYLSGGMTSQQEGDFFIQVALDKELQQELKAQRVIESALRKDFETEPTEHTAMRARVAASLAATSMTARSARMADANAARRTTSPRRSRWALAPAQWLLASGVALAFTVGAVMVLPTGRLSAPQMPADQNAVHLNTSTHAATPPTTRPAESPAPATDAIHESAVEIRAGEPAKTAVHQQATARRITRSATGSDLHQGARSAETTVSEIGNDAAAIQRDAQTRPAVNDGVGNVALQPNQKMRVGITLRLKKQKP